MKRLALVAAVVAIAACTTKEGTESARDTAALAPAPAMSDTMKMDSTMMMKDSTKMTKKP